MASFAERRHYSHGGRQGNGQAPPPIGFGRGAGDSDTDGTVADNFLGGGGGRPSRATSPRRGGVDRERLRCDLKYLLHAICGKFQEVDTYHRGLITSSGFAKALQAIGLNHEDREVDDILQYCSVTGDGYVIYKDLLSALGPVTPRAKQTTANLAIFPHEAMSLASELSQPSRSTAGAGGAGASQASPPQGSLAGRSDAIRKVYARWERGHLSDAGFREELRGIGCVPTAEFERLLTTHGPSRSLPFGRLVYALQAEENDGRRARTHHEVRPGSSIGGGDAASGRRTAWDGAQPSESSSRRPGGSDVDGGDKLRQLICDFIDGALPAVAFRRELSCLGMAPTPELERLVRTHESGACMGFGDFARLLMRQTPGNANARISSAPQRRGGFAASGANAGVNAGAGAGVGGNLLGAFAVGWGDDDAAMAVAAAAALPCTPASRRGAPGGHASAGCTPPFAVGSAVGGAGAGSEAASASSALGGRRRPIGLGDGVSAASSAAVPCGQAHSPASSSTSVAAASRPGSAASASAPLGRGSSHGDIIGWGGEQEIAARQPAPRPPRAQHEDFLQWGGLPQGYRDDRDDGSGKGAVPSKFGKRFFSGGAAAGERAPFGRDADVDVGGRAPPVPSAAPFGTEADRWSRPDQCGTDEYRSANRARSRGGLR